MKKVLFIALLMGLLTAANSQIVTSFQVPVGVSSRKCLTMGANVNLQIGPVIFGSGFDAQMSRKVEDGDLYWCRLGIAPKLGELNAIEVSGGFGSYFKSSDNKSLNKGVKLVNVQYVRNFEVRPGALFAGITYTKEVSIFSAGLRFTFRGRERYGCPSANVR